MRARYIKRNTRMFFADDGGFSTIGMVLALLISLSLVLSSAQIYRIRSSAAHVQNIADASALAAENQVASFYVVAQVCDCVILSLSLAGSLCVGLGVVAACVPPAQGLSTQMVHAGKSILEARTRFAETAAQGLNQLQRMLPVFAACNAAAVARANSTDDASFMAIALLCPLQGEPIAVGSSQAESELISEAEASQQRIAQAAQDAEDLARQANEHRQRAFEADCGNAPGYCMYERAATLAGMQGQENPHYSSADTWSFAAALQRARTYYYARYNQEHPATDALDEQARSAIRKQFYAYAYDQVNSGYVYESTDSFDAYFPLLPSNTQRMRESSMYTDIGWPVSANEEGVYIAHAWEGCPGIEGDVLGYVSVAQMEADGFPRCSVCEFAASSVGKVAAASTSIENGFEYHYQIVAREAALYQQQRSQASSHFEAVKNPVQHVLDQVVGAIKEAMDVRIHVAPPGCVGAIAVVIEAGGVRPADIIPNTIVQTQGSLGTCVALSGSTLVPDSSSETETVVSSLLDGLASQSFPVAVPHAAIGLWSDLLVVYTQGIDGLEAGIAHALNSLPLVGASGLGTWAANKLREGIDAIGFTPPDLYAYKPVVVNSFHVATADETDFGKAIVSSKQALSTMYGPLPQTIPSAAVALMGGSILARYEEWDATFVVARIELFGGSVSVPIEITLPPSAKEAGGTVIEKTLDALAFAVVPLTEIFRWE